MNWMLLILLLYSIKGEDDGIDILFPTPKLQEDYDPELTYVDEIDGCIFRATKNKSLICIGLDCHQFPGTISIPTETLKIKSTSISVIRKYDLHSFSFLKILQIEFNLELTKIEAGCFQNLTRLKNLSISFNHNIETLEENVFEGLVELKELNLNKNGFKTVFDITWALSPKYVPALKQLNMNENLFRYVLEDDFKVMEGGVLEEVQMLLCQIDAMHPKSFNPLKKLQSLRLGQNQFAATVIQAVINETIQQHLPLKYLDLYDAAFRREIPYTLLELIAQTNITHLRLGKNNFDNLNEDSFPEMPNLVVLDLSNCILLDIAPNTFNKLPNLRTLQLSGNRLPSVCSGILVPQLKKLDLSGNSGNPVSRSYFRVDDNVFLNMTSLIALQMSFNLISQITAYTFTGLVNLQYLGLKNATLFGIDNGAFRHFRYLKYLNLENNKITININAEMFKGMEQLQTLLLGGCSIESLPSNPSPFAYLPNITYLGLGENFLYTISPIIFPPLKNLKSLDLSLNKLTEWNERIFKNVSLKALDISQNKFKTLTKPMLEDFRYLDMLNLEGNPFSCDCSLFPAAKWLQKYNFSVQCFINSNIPAKCVNPDEWGQISIVNYVTYLQNNSDQCDLSSTFNKIILISVMSALLILTTVLSILGYIYRLHIRHWMLLLRMAFRRYVRRRKNNFNSESENFKYDAFVSYSNEDQDFVINLVSVLENSEPHLKLCVYERDFQIGCAISESVLESVASSRKTLLIISDSFAKSQWCRWEVKLAEYHHLFFKDGDITGPQATLLMILLNSVSTINMTPTLKYLLKTRIYLEWNSEPEKQVQFWEKLKKKLSTPNNDLYESMTISET